MRKLMILGAGPLQLPAIWKAKEMGYIVAAVDKNRDAPGVSQADVFYNISTIDVERITQAARDFMPDGIMTMATDMPVRAVAAVGKELGLPAISEETALNATDKHRMIECFKEFNVPSPWFHVIRSENEFNEINPSLIPPYIIKPVDNSGSRGVVLVSDAKDASSSYHYSIESSRSGTVLAQEYMKGHEVSVECFAHKGEIYVLQITDKLTTGAPHFVEMGHSQPSRLSQEFQKQITRVAISACKSVGIQMGPVHAEMILTLEGPKMVELGARMGGDCITSHLVPLSTGIDMIAATIHQACGDTPDILPKWAKGSAIRYIQAPCGVIWSINGVEKANSINGIREVFLFKDVGDFSCKVRSSTDRIGYVIAQGVDLELAESACINALGVISVQVS